MLQHKGWQCVALAVGRGEEGGRADCGSEAPWQPLYVCRETLRFQARRDHWTMLRPGRLLREHSTLPDMDGRCVDARISALGFLTTRGPPAAVGRRGIRSRAAIIETGSVVCVTAPRWEWLRARGVCGFRFGRLISRGTMTQNPHGRTLGHSAAISAEIQGTAREGHCSGRLTRIKTVANINGPRRSEGEAQVRGRDSESTAVTDGYCLLRRSSLQRQGRWGGGKSGTKEEDGTNKVADRNRRGGNDYWGFFDFREYRSCSLCTWLHRE